MGFIFTDTNVVETVWKLMDYDEIDGIDTHNFNTNRDKIKIIEATDPFLYYLDGFFHNLLDNATIYHGYYSTDKLTLKMFCEKLDYPVRVGIWMAWNMYNERNPHDDPLNVEIYDKYCGELYKDDFFWESKEFRKWFQMQYIAKFY